MAYTSTPGLLSLSNPELAVSVLSRSLIASQMLLDSFALLLVGARSPRLNLASDTKKFCCILRGPGGERIMDVVPRGTELELQLRLVVGQAAHICNNLHVKSTLVY